MKKNHPFLKIAGVKNIDEFYQKFPTEKAFMAKHGAKLQKADGGGYYIPGAGYSEDIKAIGKYVKKSLYNSLNVITGVFSVFSVKCSIFSEQ